MRPLRLELEGFTVYKRPQVIDFERLNFFVIQGKTGAGKTSIVDAITYALYGKVPRYGNADATSRVLSKGSNRLRVSLEFSVGGRRYRIERFFRQKPRESILRVEEEGRRLNLTRREVESWVKKTTGLDYRTFTKVILLPQGEFDRFLKPKEPRERREILIELLNLEIFERMREMASERCRELEGELNALRTEAEALKDLSEEVLKQLEEERRNTERRAEELKKEVRELEELLSRAREKEKLTEELEKLRSSLASLEEKREEIETLRERLDRARKVLPYLPYMERVENVERELRDLRIERDKLLKSRTELIGEMENVKAEREKVEEEFRRLPSLREELQRTLRELERLEEALEELRAIERIKKDIQTRGREIEKRRETYEECEARLSKGERLIEEVKRELEGLDYDEEEHESLIKKAERRKLLLRDLERLREIEDSLKREKAKRERILGDLERKRKELEEKERELERAGMEAHARHIRSLLKEGDRCPVCGGVFRGGELEEAGADLGELKNDLENVRKEVLALERSLASVEANVSALEREKSALSETIESERELMEEDLEVKLRELEEKRRKRRELEEKLRRYQERFNQLLREREEALRELERLRSEVDSLRNLLQEKEVRARKLTEGRLELSLVDRERDRLRQRKEDLESRIGEVEERREKINSYWEELSRRLVAVDTRLREMEALLDKREKERKENLRRLAPLFEEFGGIEEVREFALSEEELKGLEEKVEGFEREVEILRDKVKETEARLEEVSDLPPSGEVESRLSLLKEELEECLRRAGEIGSEIEQKRRLLEEKSRLKERISQIEGELRLYSRLREDLRSDRLQDFASSLMLKRIVERASEYLFNFTNNYEFLMDSKGDLVVFDRAQGVERDVRSLSGGETFLASLSLALGVSDVLSADAHLESLFIDEGFGSLDEETRERVSDILEVVKQRINRMVGIISHIPDLAERFHQRIIVRKQGDFSTLEVIY